MSSKQRGEVRRAQLITTYGVGAVVALRDESFMVAGTDRWDVQSPNLHEPLLERVLGLRGFVLPPASDDMDDIPVIRFPRYSSCPQCHRIAPHHQLSSNYRNSCNRCGVDLMPSRFVIACEKGHIDDFPYLRWAHRGAPRQEGSHDLEIHSRGRSASLRDVEIRCSCGAWQDMDGAFGKFALRNITRCFGSRPWLTEPDAGCSETPRVLQRGASNGWFSLVRSAISIPPWSEGAFALLNQYWGMLRNIPREALKPTLAGMRLAEGTTFTIDDLVEAVATRLGGEGEGGAFGHDDIRRQEHEALLRGRPERSSAQEFVCVPAGEQTDRINAHFERVMVARRLREVRALIGFTRVRPAESNAEDRERIAPLSTTDMDWLPAIEVRGEGVFLELDKGRLQIWENDPNVLARAAIIDSQYDSLARRYGGEPDRRITPRLLLVHTLAHIFIDQWALDSGYPASSLRERLYVDEDMAGLLIYTATSDAAGSLGGLTAQARPERLDESLFEAIARATWCSSDPLCIEADATGVDALNLGACHSCCLLPEVSCEEMNLLLDRATVVGTPENPSLGFFDGG